MCTVLTLPTLPSSNCNNFNDDENTIKKENKNRTKKS